VSAGHGPVEVPQAVALARWEALTRLVAAELERLGVSPDDSAEGPTPGLLLLLPRTFPRLPDEWQALSAALTGDNTSPTRMWLELLDGRPGHYHTLLGVRVRAEEWVGEPMLARAVGRG
jgi:hypothetical protein